MSGVNSVCFSLFKGDVPSPVKVFEKNDWNLESGVTLTVCIIGKSHRICFRSGSDFLTEFIAYSMENLSSEPVDQKFLKPGESFTREFVHRSLHYKAKIDVVRQVFLSFGEFLKTVSYVESYKTMFREFKKPLLNLNSQPFTGIVIVPVESRVYTVHTYPEENYSIISVVEVNVVGHKFVP